MKIYIFGNLLVPEDALPLKIIPQLKRRFPKIEFVISDPNDNFPPEGEKDLIILDAVKGIKKPIILDLEDLEKNKKNPISPHDYDLLFHLLLLKKMKKIENVKIIGLPYLEPFNFQKMSSAGHTGVKSSDKFFNLIYNLILRCIQH